MPTVDAARRRFKVKLYLTAAGWRAECKACDWSHQLDRTDKAKIRVARQAARHKEDHVRQELGG